MDGVVVRYRVKYVGRGEGREGRVVVRYRVNYVGRGEGKGGRVVIIKV